MAQGLGTRQSAGAASGARTGKCDGVGRTERHAGTAKMQRSLRTKRGRPAISRSFDRAMRSSEGAASGAPTGKCDGGGGTERRARTRKRRRQVRMKRGRPAFCRSVDWAMWSSEGAASGAPTGKCDGVGGTGRRARKDKMQRPLRTERGGPPIHRSVDWMERSSEGAASGAPTKKRRGRRTRGATQNGSGLQIG